jgi:AraC-like DNA-binding protein
MTAFFRMALAPRPALREHVAYLWASQDDNDDPLLPDAAVELVWSGKGLFIRGADTRAHAIGSYPERTFVAIRFKPGAAADVLGLRGGELADARVGVSEVWGVPEMERLESMLRGCPSPEDAAAVLEEAVLTRVRGRPDVAVQGAVAVLRHGRTPVGELADRLGLSERQLRRKCLDALGYGPKMLDSILRFQRFRTLAARRRLGLAQLAALAGYADQSHLTRECRRFAGESPSSLLRRRRMTVSF